MRNLANFLLFQAGWFAVVKTAAEGNMWVGPMVVLAIVVLHLAFVVRAGERHRELVYVAAVGLAGLLADTGLGLLGATTYPTSAEAWPWAVVPPWITSLWVLFATLPRHSMGWLHGRRTLAVVFGALGGPLSYLAGTRFGAVGVADNELLTWGALAVEYAVAMPILLAFAERSEPSEADPPVAAAGSRLAVSWARTEARRASSTSPGETSCRPRIQAFKRAVSEWTKVAATTPAGSRQRGRNRGASSVRCTSLAKRSRLVT